MGKEAINALKHRKLHFAHSPWEAPRPSQAAGSKRHSSAWGGPWLVSVPSSAESSLDQFTVFPSLKVFKYETRALPHPLPSTAEVCPRLQAAEGQSPPAPLFLQPSILHHRSLTSSGSCLPTQIVVLSSRKPECVPAVERTDRDREPVVVFKWK